MTATTALQVHTPPEMAPAMLAPVPLDKAALKQQLARLSDPDMLKLQNELAAAYDAACKALVGPGDEQQDGNRKFKKKSAWRKLGRHFGINTEIVRDELRLLGEGEFLAVCAVRAISSWGQVAESLGACGSDEESGRRTITMADAIGTAQTRATNRAISDLIAMGEVSAEELGERKTRTRPELTLEDAEALLFPWRDHAKYGGRPLKEVSTKMLLAVSKWAKDKIDAGDDGEKLADLYRACVLITEQRPDLAAARGESPQPTAGEEKGAGEASAQAPESAAPADAPAVANAAPATEPTPTPDPAAESARIHQLTDRLNILLRSERVAPKVQARVRERLAESELTPIVLQQAVGELETAEAPF
jgi:hypothetical protein